jgi:hypothetical protein
MSDNDNAGPMMGWLSRVTRRLLLVAAIFVLAYFILPWLLWTYSRADERKTKYASARQRIEAAGGWEAVERACLALSTNRDGQARFTGFFYWRGPHATTNSLPPTLGRLQPRWISLNADSDRVPILKVHLYGVGRTGTYPEPYYGIWVVCTNLPDYTPVIQSRGQGMRGLITRKGPMIFEVL